MESPTSNPYLSGNFAPIHHEIEQQNLLVTGEIPNDLTGIYMRNGPNPAFPPISYTYPFDGDGMIHQFIYTPTRTADAVNPRNFNALIKFNVNDNNSQIHSFGPHAEIGEAIFVPSGKSNHEDQGYIMLFIYDNSTQQSEFVILDAANFMRLPLARVQIPQRIPHGLHGSWMPGEWQW